MTRSFILTSILTLCSFSIILLFSNCAPIFSELQSARTVGKGNIDVTASFSSVSLRDTEEKESLHVQNHIDMQAAYGLTDKTDLRIRYAYLWLGDEGGSVNILGIGPKFSFTKDKLAAYLPIGLAFGNDINQDATTWQVHPTLLFTVPVLEKLDINSSIKALLPFESDRSTLTAFNVGLGIRISEEFTLRPEYGMLFEHGEQGHFTHFSLGMTYMPPGVRSRE